MPEVLLAPSSISFGKPRAGRPLAITCGEVQSNESGEITYIWERKIDGNPFHQIGITGINGFLDTVPTEGRLYNARVKAVDAQENESEYCAGTPQAISHNRPPQLSGQDEDRGVITAPFFYKYALSDEDGDDAVAMTEDLDGAVLRSFTARRGRQYTADFAHCWLSLTNGPHVLKIAATDSDDDRAVRSITFSRSVTRIAAMRKQGTPILAQQIFLSLFPKPQEGAAVVNCQVCNNANDESPAWEEISEKVNSSAYVFTNTVAANSPGVGYRFTITGVNGAKVSFHTAAVRYS